MSTNASSFPTGFVITNPGKTLENALLVDFSAYIVNTRTSRNILSGRNAIKSNNKIVKQDSFVLEFSEPSGVPKEYIFNGSPDNRATILASNFPVQVIVENETGTLNLGELTTLFLTAYVKKLTIKNLSKNQIAEVNLVQS